MYRSFMPYGFGSLTAKTKGPVITNNYKRVVEVWMDDEYKEYFYTREPSARYVDTGDISTQLKLKEDLQCKSFDWFMTNVAPDMLSKFPKLPPNVELGSLVNIGSKTCLDTLGGAAPSQMGVSECYGHGNGQLMRLNEEGQLGIGERCVDASKSGVQHIVCPSGSVSGPWKFNKQTQQLVHKRGNRCLSVDRDHQSTRLAKCDSDDKNQRWLFKEIIPAWAENNEI